MLFVAIAVFVTGLVVTISVSALQKSQRAKRAAATAAQLQEFAQALKTSAQQRRGEWPPAVNAAGLAPVGLDAGLRAKWSRPTPIGGRYLWAPDALQRGRRYRATIGLFPVNGDPLTTDRLLLEEIDRRIDDGDLSSGNFLLGFRDQPFLVIEP